MNRLILNFVLSVALAMSFSSCFQKFGAHVPLNSRKLKKKVQPPYDFSKALLDYRKQKGYWPKSELDFSAFNRLAVNDLFFKEFIDWHLGANSNDSIYVHFVHDPVFKNAHIGGVPIPGREVKIRTLYVYTRGMVETQFDK